MDYWSLSTHCLLKIGFQTISLDGRVLKLRGTSASETTAQAVLSALVFDWLSSLTESQSCAVATMLLMAQYTFPVSCIFSCTCVFPP